jgi:hypothetical protein
MSHVRSQFRAAIKAILITAMPAHKIFSSRRYKINASELPIVDMRFSNENSEHQTMSNVLERTATLHIRVTRNAVEESIDDVLDDDAVLVEHALANAVVAGVKSAMLVQTNFTDSADGDRTNAEVILRYDITYRTADNDVETARN